MDLIEISGGCVDRICEADPFLGASVASLPDLLRLRGQTVAERGNEGDVADFKWLLSRMSREGKVLPTLLDEELENIAGAAVT